jgi:serine/threonine-protein kinase
MGSVWEARHESLRRRVAIKFIHAAYANDDEARLRFENEARAASALQSRHAVEMFDHGVADSGEPFIVMEFLVGESLEQRLRRQGMLPLALTSRVVTQVSRALQQAHDLGIVHRDLKPENIFLSPDEEPGAFVAKVLDFGVAKVSSANAALADPKTKTGTLLGTPYYMAPEQARGSRTIDGRADVWSLGVVAYRCVTGAMPFDGDALGELLVRICTGVYTPPSKHVPGLPPAFDAWIARALGVEPRQRFATATDLAEALAEIASSAGSLERTFDRQLSQRPHAVAPRTEPLGVVLPRSDGSVAAFAATQQSIPPSAPGAAHSTRLSVPPPVRARRHAIAAGLLAAVLVAAAVRGLRARAPSSESPAAASTFVGAAASADTAGAMAPSLAVPSEPMPVPAVPEDTRTEAPDPSRAAETAPRAPKLAPVPASPPSRRAASSADPGF